MIDKKLLEIAQYTKEGYQPVIDFNSWRVAVLNFSDNQVPQNITKMERHLETDEVFVLLAGECLLFIGEGDQQVTKILLQKMEPLKVYNVKRGVWHASALSKDAMVLIIENKDTDDTNSQMFKLSETQRRELVNLT